MEGQKYYRRGGLVWPVILVGAGVVLLLNNLGAIGWGIWETLFRLWPVLLIAVGLDILIGRRSILGSILVAVLLLVTLAAAVIWGAPQAEFNAGAASTTTQTIQEPLNGATRGDLSITFGAGNLLINALNESAGLVEGKIDLGPNEQLSSNLTRDGDTARYTLQSRGLHLGPLDTDWRTQVRTWDLGLNRDIPLKLDLATGVGVSEIDLSKLQVTDLNVRTGVGKVTLTLPRTGKVQGRIQGGVGAVTIIVPRGMAVDLRTQGGLGDIHADSAFDERGDRITSSGYESAANRAELRIQGGIGQVYVKQGAGE